MCFSMQWLQHLLILAVIVGAIFAILQIIVPWALSKIGGNLVGEGVNILLQIFKIVVVAVIIIFIIYVAFSLISCLWTYGGGLSLMPR